MSEVTKLLESFGDGPKTPRPTPVEVEKPVPVYKDIKERLKAIDAARAELEKRFDTQNILVRLGDKIGKPMPSIETGCPTLDYGVLQCGGIPRGRIIEIFGPESSGKTTLTLDIIAAAQKGGGLAGFVDAEHALDPNYAESVIGVDVDNLIVSQPDYGEQALDVVSALVDTGALAVLVVDSVSALVPKAELEGNIGDVHMGLQARMMSQAMRILPGKCMKTGTTVIFINQIREKIGVMFGNPETTSGGRALKFFASVRLDVRRDNQTKVNDDEGMPAGHWMKIKCVKNKVGKPFRETKLFLDYEKGVDRFQDLIVYSKDQGVIEGDSWLSFKGERIGHGMAKSMVALRNNPQLVKLIKDELAKVRAAAQEESK